MTLPALAVLRKHWPDARIELVGNARAAALAQKRGLLDAVHSQHEARWSALFGSEPLPVSLAVWLAEFDLIVNYWPDPDAALRARFPLHDRQTYVSADPMPNRAPAAAHYCEPLRPFGLEASDYAYRFEVERPPPNALAPIAIHPGSGSPRKNWPADRWLQVMATLEAPILLILGEAEAERWSAFSSTSSAPTTPQRVVTNAVQLAIDLPLEHLVRKLATCRFFMGHDSGISHLAAACGVPSLLLFGPTVPAMWAPPAPHVRVLRRGNEMTSISVEEVLNSYSGTPK